MQIARAVSKKLADDPQPREKQKQLRILAQSHGVTWQTLKNYLNAFRFVEEMRVSNTELAKLLEDMPALAVEVFSRWSNYDIVGVNNAIRRAHKDSSSVRAIIQAEKKARAVALPNAGRVADPLFDVVERSYREKSKIQSRKDWRFFNDKNLRALQKTADQVGLMLAQIPNLFWEPPTTDIDRWAGVDYQCNYQIDLYLDSYPFRVRDKEHGTICAINVAKYSIPDQYRREARTLHSQAISASSKYDFVIMLFPEQEAIDQVLIAAPVAEKSSDDDFVQKSYPEIFQLLGPVLVTTVDVFLECLYNREYAQG
jgi:hypothetical protein